MNETDANFRVRRKLLVMYFSRTYATSLFICVRIFLTATLVDAFLRADFFFLFVVVVLLLGDDFAT